MKALIEHGVLVHPRCYLLLFFATIDGVFGFLLFAGGWRYVMFSMQVVAYPISLKIVLYF